MRKAGREIKEKILPFVNALSSSIEKMHFIKKISDLSGISQTALQDDLKKIEQESKYEKAEIREAVQNINALSRKDYIERKLLGIILWQKSLKQSNIEVNKILRELREILGVSEEQLLEKTKENQADFIFEAEVFYGEGADIQRDVGEMLKNLQEEFLKEKWGQKMRELREAEEAKDAEKSKLILIDIRDINSKIQNIKNEKEK